MTCYSVVSPDASPFGRDGATRVPDPELIPTRPTMGSFMPFGLMPFTSAGAADQGVRRLCAAAKEVVAPTLDDTDCAQFDEHRVEMARVLDELLLVCGGDLDHESIDV